MAIRTDSREAKDDGVMVDINTTPLIDVMLVLLIMLIITIPMQTHSVKLNMPAASSTPPQKQPEVVRIEVAADGTVLWDGERLPDRAALETRLAAIAAQANAPELHLRPDRSAAYKHVAAVLAAAQRKGVAKIGIVGSEQFLD